MKRKQNNHLAEGEVTGHYHEAVASDAEVYEDVYGDNSLWLDAPTGTDVEHQEHGTIPLPPGTYRTGQVLEYDPAAEEAKEVRD